MELPKFRYHPDPLVTGAVVRETGVCVCCNRQVEYLYDASDYGEDLPSKICPWCIADGSAHEQFDVTFTDTYALSSAGISDRIIEEVAQRTPGYICWQSEAWLSHCNDACAFLGDATKETVRQMTADERARFIAEQDIDEDEFADIVEHYEPAGQPAIYHFRCLHCGVNRFGMDCH